MIDTLGAADDINTTAPYNKTTKLHASDRKRRQKKPGLAGLQGFRGLLSRKRYGAKSQTRIKTICHQ